MKTLRSILGAILVLAGGILTYDLAVQNALLGQMIPLLLLLAAQVLLGRVAGEVIRSWRGIALGPVAFAIGFLAAAPLQSNGLVPSIPATGDGAATIAALAGGNLFMGTVFVLTLWSCLLALGIAIGTTRGLRRQWRPKVQSVRPLPYAAVMADLEQIEGYVTPDTHATPPGQRELAHA